MKLEKIKGKMAELNITQKNLAKALNISVQTLNAKLNGRRQITIFEAEKMIDVLEIQNPAEIFFVD